MTVKIYHDLDGNGNALVNWSNLGGGGGEPYVEINSTGTEPLADASDSIAIGEDAVVTGPDTGNRSIAIGKLARVSDDNEFFFSDDSIAIGSESRVEGQQSVAIGHLAEVAGPGTIEGALAIGANSLVSATDSLVVGNGATSNGSENIAIGSFATVDTTGSNRNILIGVSTFCENYGGTTLDSVVVGHAAGVYHNEAIAIGANSFIDGVSSVGLGANTNTESDNTVSIGHTASCGSGSDAGVAIGFSAQVGNADPGAIAIGNNPSAFSENSIAIGTNASASGGLDVIAFGARNNVTSVGSFAFGTDNVISNGTATVHTNSSSCITVGDDNVINDCAQTFIFGDQNTATGLNDAVILGEDNVMTGGVSLIAGQSNMYNNIQLGHQNTITDTTNASSIGNRIQIGLQNINNGTSSYQTIQIGSSTTVGNNSEFAIAIGTDAVIGDSAPGAVQIGIGTNNETNTLAFRQAKIAGLFGIVAPLEAGVPTSIVDDGYIRIDNTNNALYFRSGGAWVQAGGSGGGEPYVEINSSGSLPTSTGTDALAIGAGAEATGAGCIAIGAVTDAFATNTVAIGNSADAEANNAIAIGNASQSNGTSSVVLGVASIAEGDESVCIGSFSDTNLADTAVAIGRQAIVENGATSAIQLGTGTNSTASTFQFLNNRLANAEGLYTSFTSPTNYTPTDNDNVTSHLQAIDTALASAGGGGDPYFVSNSAGALPTASGTDAIAIGENTTATNNSSIAIGQSADCLGDSGISIGVNAQCSVGGIAGIAIGSSAEATGNEAIAIGEQAEARTTNAVQIGSGINNTVNTLQYLTNTIATTEGLYTSFTAPTNYTPVDNDNVTSHLEAIDTALATAGGGDPDALVFGTTQSASFSIATTDHGTDIPVDETITITLPNLASNTEVNIDLDVANKIITYAAGAGATIQAPSLTQSVQHTTVNCRFNSATSTWILRGGLT